MQKKVWIKGIKVLFFAVAWCVMGSAFDASGITKGYAGENATRGVLEISASAAMADVQADPVVEFVNRMYRTILEREPDAGSQTWITVLKDGSYTGVDVADGFIMSDEFLSKSMSNEEFVRIMYRAFFGREADAEGLATWTGYLDNGYIKKFVFAGFANSDEFQTLCDNYGITRGHIKLTMAEETPNLTEREFNVWQFVDRLYSEVLGRTPDASGMAIWSGVLLSKEYTGAKVAEGFILSDEFLNKSMTNEEYVQILYRAFFGRTADPEGLATWTNELNKGAAKQFVFAGFANSAEFGNLCESYGIEQGSVVANVPEKPYKIVNEVDGVGLSWRPVENVELYGVWRKEEGVENTYSWLANVARTDFVDTTAESGKNYVYSITSYDVETLSHSGASESVSIFFLATPEITAIYNETYSGLTLEWSAVEGAVGYEIYTEITTGSEPYWGKIATLEGNDTLSFTHRGANVYGSSYKYTVCALAGEDGGTRSAYNTEGWGAVRLQTPEAICYPNFTNKTIHLEWNEYYANGYNVNVDIDGYEILLLQDSVEYKIYDYSGGYSGGGNGSSYLPFVRKEFWESDGLEDLEGKLTFQVRSYKSVDGLGKCYSGWSEEVELVTLTEMDARLNRLVEELTASAETDLEKAIEIYKWVVFNTDYVHAGSAIGQQVGHGEAVILHGKAICDGYARAFMLLAERAGLEVNYVDGYPEEGEGHAWNQVKIDGKWYNLDATWGDSYYVANPEVLEESIKIYWQFLLSDEEFDETHGKYFLDRTEAHECPEDYDIFGYLIERDGGGNDVYASDLEELRSKIEQKLQEGVDFIDVWYVNRDMWMEISEYVEVMNAIAENATDIVYFSQAKTIEDLESWIYKAELAVVSYEDIEGGKTLVIPDGMSSIGEHAFANLDDLERVVLPDSVTSIGTYAFAGCKNLKEINIPDGVTVIMDYAFQNCSSLLRVDIPDGVSSIMGNTFQGCSSLEEVKLHDGVKSIGFAAFMNCSSLKDIELPEGVRLGESVFSGCSSLTEIRIPEGMTKFEGFSGCSSLERIELPESLVAIKGGALSGCNSLKSIRIPEGVTEIGAWAFKGCGSLTEIQIPDGVTVIEEGIFSDCTGLVKVELPDGVTTIKDSAFSGCSSLTEVNIPESVTSIGKSVFSGCSSLTGIDIPDGVTLMRNYVFQNCSNLTEVYLPDSVTTIGDYAFQGCGSLAELYLPNGVTKIGKYAFRDCTGLVKVHLPDSVTTIGEWAFYECKSLTEVNISDGVTEISSHVFRGCSSLTEVNIPDGVTTIGDSAFSSCESLVAVDISDSVTIIGDSAFSGCMSLTEVNIPGSVTTIGGMAFYGCSSLAEISIPDGVTSISRGMFRRCSGLTRIDIPESVTSIDKDAFLDCGLDITICCKTGSYAETYAIENRLAYVAQ